MEIKDLIIDDRDQGIFKVHRSALTSKELFALEQERVFEQCWLYLGHESEVSKPGEYRRREVAGRPVFFARGNDGQVRAFLNSCPHRGAMICRQDEGATESFQCFYHAWTFNNQGQLIGVPDEEGYGPDFDKSKLGLKPPPRVESYRGFCFVSFNPQIEPLVEYLAGAREYLDLIADQSEAGMKITKGTNKYTMRANWKLLCENSMDGYHLQPTHQTYLDYISSLGTDTSGVDVRRPRAGVARALGNGHAVIESEARNGRPIAHWHPMYGEDAKEEIAGVRAELVDKYGEEWAFRMCDTSRNLLIYPNLVINDIMAITVQSILAGGSGPHGRNRLEPGAGRRVGPATGAAVGQFPDLPGTRRVCNPRRRGGPGVLPAGFSGEGTGVVRHIQGNAPGPQELGRAADAGHVAPVARPHDGPGTRQHRGSTGPRPPNPYS